MRDGALRSSPGTSLRRTRQPWPPWTTRLGLRDQHCVGTANDDYLHETASGGQGAIREFVGLRPYSRHSRFARSRSSRPRHGVPSASGLQMPKGFSLWTRRGGRQGHRIGAGKGL